MTDTSTSSAAGAAPPPGAGSGDLMESHEHLAGAGLIKPGYAPRLTNEDLAPLKQADVDLVQHLRVLDVRRAQRRRVRHRRAACSRSGLASWQVLIALLVGITIVYFLCNLVAKP